MNKMWETKATSNNTGREFEIKITIRHHNP
jgi:hypothetical protein